MRSFSIRARVLGAIAAVSATVTCGGCADDIASDPPSPVPLAPLVVDTQQLKGNPWKLTGGGDFNFDFMSDIIWSNTVDNRISIWLMNGSQVLAKGPDIAGPVGDGWTVVSALDMTFDGMADVLWYHADKTMIAVWSMNGTQLLAAGPPISGPPGDGWKVSGLGDFNHDGRRDVLWYDREKDLITIWFMNGTTLLFTGPVIPGRGG